MKEQLKRLWPAAVACLVISAVLAYIYIYICDYSPNGSVVNTCLKNSDTMAELEALQKVNAEVAQSLEYGVFDYPNDYLLEEAVLDVGGGDCGEYAYLFWLQARRLGYMAYIVGTTSGFANHALVEVQVNGDWYCFDPTNGIYYLSDFDGLIGTPDFEAVKQGTPVMESPYTSSAFFDGAQVQTYYRHRGGMPLEAQCPEYTVSISPDGGDGAAEYARAKDQRSDTWVGNISPGGPVCIEWDFERPVELDYISFSWYFWEEAPQTFVVEALDEQTGEYYTIVEEQDLPVSMVYDHMLPATVVSSRFRITFLESHGERGCVAISEIVLNKQ